MTFCLRARASVRMATVRPSPRTQGPDSPACPVEGAEATRAWMEAGGGPGGARDAPGGHTDEGGVVAAPARLGHVHGPAPERGHDLLGGRVAGDPPDR